MTSKLRRMVKFYPVQKARVSFVKISYIVTRNPALRLKYLVGNKRRRKCEIGNTKGLEQEKDSNSMN